MCCLVLGSLVLDFLCFSGPESRPADPFKKPKL